MLFVYIKDFQKPFIQSIGMLTASVVVLDFEGFRSKKSGFIVKELAKTCNNCTDTFSFSPPHSFNSLTLGEQKSYQWVLKISSWFGLGEKRLPIFLSTAISSECSASISSIIFLCEGCREN